MLTAVQCGKGEIDANLSGHLEVLTAARTDGCGLAVFPEMSLTGSVDPATRPTGCQRSAIRPTAG